jgi:phosphatidylinositol dimannoside acyltransferase
MQQYFLLRLAAWAVPHVGEVLGYQLFGGLAEVLYLTARRTRRLVEHNLAHALGPDSDPAQVRRYARGIFRNLLWNYYEMLHMPEQTVDDLRARIHLEGVAYGEAAVSGPTGAIFVFPHVANLEFLMQIPRLYPQYRFLMLVERMRDDRVFGLMRSLRAAHGVQVVPVSDMLRIMRLFKQGWNLVLAGDLDSTGSGITIEFFGAPARMPDGAVRMALRSGAPLLIVYGWRDLSDAAQGRPGYCLRISPPVPLLRTADFQSDVRRGVEEVGKRLEAIIAAHLDQWLAFHPFWIEDDG